MGKITDVYTVREPGMEGDWYGVVKVVDGHMELLPHVYTYEDATHIVEKYTTKTNVA